MDKLINDGIGIKARFDEDAHVCKPLTMKDFNEQLEEYHKENQDVYVINPTVSLFKDHVKDLDANPTYIHISSEDKPKESTRTRRGCFNWF